MALIVNLTNDKTKIMTYTVYTVLMYKNMYKNMTYTMFHLQIDLRVKIVRRIYKCLVLINLQYSKENKLFKLAVGKIMVKFIIKNSQSCFIY